jgi:GNAT superfamily N-acetyltransferase
MSEFKWTIRPTEKSDADWIKKFITQRWGGEFVVDGGVCYYPHKLSGFLAFDQDQALGLVTYCIEEGQCHIITIDSLRPVVGIGSALIDAVKEEAIAAGCGRIWLITTNDNLNALRFYQKRGFVLVAVRRNAIDITRQHKPVPEIGAEGIPIRDEIELEMILNMAE